MEDRLRGLRRRAAIEDGLLFVVDFWTALLDAVGALGTAVTCEGA